MRPWITMTLIGAVFISALALVAVRHESRKLFVELQVLHSQREVLHEEWSRLQLELATWGTHSRVEEIARNEIGMILPSADNLVVVFP